MAVTVNYTASLRTRKAASSSNSKSNAACQGYYLNTYNYVGIIHFPGMALAHKVIKSISLSVTSAAAGYGASHTKTVYLRGSNYQAASQSGVTGLDYCGEELGTFSGSFFENTGSYNLTGTLLKNLADYFAAGNNTLCLYNPTPEETSHGYSSCYLQWTECSITVTYDEPVSIPTLSSKKAELGQEIIIQTNRITTAATHILSYNFASTTGTIAANVGDAYTWTLPLSLAAMLPSATSGLCTIICQTYIGDALTGTTSCTLELVIPASVVPEIQSIVLSDKVAGIAEQFGAYVQSQSQLMVSIAAAGVYGSSITAYRATLNAETFTASSFVTPKLNMAGENTLSVTVTDSRGRSTTQTRKFDVLAYSPPSLTKFLAERCSIDGSATQIDGVNVRVSVLASVSALDQKNNMNCAVYYKLRSSSAWIKAADIEPNNYTVTVTNLLLSQTYDTLNSYELKVCVQDYFGSVEQSVLIGTKRVMIDLLRGGLGIAFGKIAELEGVAEFAWPLKLPVALGVEFGGTGAITPEGACAAIGALPLIGGSLTGNLTIQGALYPSLVLQPTNEGQSNRAVIEGSYAGAASLASWQDASSANRRMLEIRNRAYSADLNYALVLRDVIDGVYSTYRLFHEGMTEPIPLSHGGTGARNAKNALSNLGIFFSETLPDTGTDGQICLVPV